MTDDQAALDAAEIARRKTHHLDLCISGDVGFRGTTPLFDQVRLLHDSLPELDFAALDRSVTLFGKRLRAPIHIAGMTGGTDRAGQINRELASIAEERGYGFGFGSQRPILKDRANLASYQVRDVAPNALILGNIGVVQATQLSLDQVEDLVGAVGADALCVHLNPAQELIQVDGDRDFRGNLERLALLVQQLSVPVVAKETGCGVSPRVARRLREAGVRHVDVSGAGGTSWVAVEVHRAPPERKPVGETFWDWGIPTAAAVAYCAPHGFETIIATGGIASGLDIAKAVALGASVGGIARHVLQALDAGGRAGALAYLDRLETEFATAMLLTGSPTVASLREVPRVIGPELDRWLNPRGP